MSNFTHHGYIVSRYFLEGNTQSIWPDFWGGFAGASFAFLFGLVSYWLIKRFERFIIHRDALVKLERALNDCIDGIGINRRVAQDTAGLLAERKLTFSRLIPFELPSQTSIDLASIVLVNNFYSYERGVHRINADIRSINYALTRFEDTLIAGQPLDKANFDFLREKLIKELSEYLDALLDETLNLLSSIRLYMKKLIGRNLFLYANTHTRWDIVSTNEEISRERSILEKEIMESDQDRSD